MRVLLFCSEDLNGCLNLNRLAEPLIAQGHRVAFVLSNFDLTEERGTPLADRKIFFEKDLAKSFLRFVSSQPSRPGTLKSFEQLGDMLGCGTQRINPDDPHGDMLRLTDGFSPEVILCCRFDYILRRAVFSRPGLHTALNLHSGLLPGYAGPDATFRAMQQGLRQSGCTLHLIEEKIDTGNIVGTSYFDVDYTQSVFRNRCKAYRGGIRLFLDLMSDCERPESFRGTPQDMSQSHYYPFASESEWEELSTKSVQSITAEDFSDAARFFMSDFCADKFINTLNIQGIWNKIDTDNFPWTDVVI